MTPDEMVRAIHRLEGQVFAQNKVMDRLLVNQRILEQKMHAMIAQQNQLLGAIRGMEAPVAQG